MTLDPTTAARVIADVRTATAQRYGCREWDVAGIRAAVVATDGPPGAVLAAAALAAEDATLDKPSAAAFKAHWPRNAVEPVRVSNNIPCPEHTGQTMPCPKCAEGKRPPTPDEMEAAKKAAKDARDAYHARIQALRGELGKVR